MANNTNFPAISRQVTELVLAGSSAHAEEAINDTAEQFGDLAVVAVLDTMEPQVAAMHLSAFDGGKLSLATLLISPKAWASRRSVFLLDRFSVWIRTKSRQPYSVKTSSSQSLKPQTSTIAR